MKYVPEVSVITHSAIRIQGPLTVYADPFHLPDAPHDADLVLLTHEHHDHLSPEDILKVSGPGTRFVLPLSCRKAAEEAGLSGERTLFMRPGERLELEGCALEAAPAYNVDKAFHTRDREWLGYVVEMLGRRYYIAGDTDDNEDIRKIRCHVALLPVGGTYTMTASQAAELANAIRPEIAVPTHFGDIVGKKEDADTFASLLDSSILCDTEG